MRIHGYPFLLSPNDGTADTSDATTTTTDDSTTSTTITTTDKGLTQTQAQEWFTTLPAEQQADATLTRYRDKPLGELGKAFLEQRRVIGADPATIIRKPSADATPEQISAYHKALGVPETPAGYDTTTLNLPASVKRADDVEKPFLEVAHKLGATPQIVNGIMEWFYELGSGFEQQQRVEGEARKAGNLQTIRESWGANSERRQAQINNFASTHDPQGKALAKLKAVGLDHDPDVVFWLDRMEKSGQNGEFIGSNTPTQLMTKEQAAERIIQIRGDDKHPYNAAEDGSREHEAAKKEMQMLYRVRDGESV